MTVDRPTRVAVVGSGWRAEHFFRIINALPDRFELVGVAVRREAEAARLAGHGIDAVTELGRLDDLDPDFVVVATSAEANADVCEELAANGHSILLETPPGVNDDELDRMLLLEQSGADVQVAEQYPFQPLLAARLAVISSGRLGEISSVDVSVAHGYHGIALIRAALGVGIDEFDVSAHQHHSTITVGPDRAGPPTDDGLETSLRTVATIRFGDRVGMYDWSDDQYFSWIRSLRFVVRGTRGELDGHEVRHLLADGTPVQQTLRRWDSGLEGNLEGLGHRGYLLGDQWVYRNPFPQALLTDDEIAIATVLQRMSEHVANRTPVYSLDEAVQDTRIALAITRAARG
jgi:predicted dehydrogenase